jgi:glycerol kinase
LKQLKEKVDAKNLNHPLACGITNQRESIVAFRKSTGKAIINAISWMDVRTIHLVDRLKLDTARLKRFELLTGLKASTFFSAFKIQWILENVFEAQKAAKENDLALATIDTWILWKLTNGISFYTDSSNASRTFLFDIKTGHWSRELLKYFNVNSNWLPEIKFECYGQIAAGFPFSNLPITALIGDQQASLIGHWGKGFIAKTKCTFGTGAFLLRSLPDPSSYTNPNALRTVIIPGQLAEEYPIVCAGSLIKWLQKSLLFFEEVSDLNQMDFTPDDPDNSVYFVPNLSGCLFPSWDPSARGSFFNISLQTGQRELILSVFEAVAFCIKRTLEIEYVPVLSVDGGMCTNRHFSQLLANVCNTSIRKFTLITVFIYYLFIYLYI